MLLKKNLVTGPLLSWSSAMMTMPIKRSHDHSDTSHDPPEKRIKTDQCEETSSPALIEEHEEYITINDEGVANTISMKNSNNDEKEQMSLTESKSLTDCRSLIIKLMEYCHQSTNLDSKEVDLLWDEFNSFTADKVLVFVYTTNVVSRGQTTFFLSVIG